LLLSRAATPVNILEYRSIDGDAITPAELKSVIIPDVYIGKNGYLSWSSGMFFRFSDSHVVPIMIRWGEFTELQNPDYENNKIDDIDGCFFANAITDYDNTEIVISLRVQNVTDILGFTVTLKQYDGNDWVVVDSGQFEYDYYIYWKYTSVVSVNIAAGDYLILEVLADSVLCQLDYIAATVSMIYVETQIDSVTVSAVDYREAWRAVVAKLTGQNNAISSSIFNDIHLGVILSTRYIRQIEGTNPGIAFTLEDLFNSLSIFNIGIGVNNGVLEIERMSYFFNPYVIIDLSDRINESLIEKAVIPELYANRLKFGFNTSEYGYLGGIFEFNTASEWSTVIKPINQEFAIVSPFRADSTGIYQAVEEATNPDNEVDQESDADLFLLDVQTDEVEDYKAKTDEEFDFISGSLKTNDLFNLDYTPARILRRWGSYIRAILHQNLTSFLRWQKSDKNSTLESQKTGEGVIVENSDIRVDELEVNRWIPEAYTVQVPLKETDLQAIEANPYGIIKLSDTKYGWILDYKSKNENRTSDLRLLRVNLKAVTPIPYKELGFGKLYNWHAVSDIAIIVNSTGLTPFDWRVATKDDFDELIEFCGGSSVAGGMLKETGFKRWLSPNTGAVDTYGFRAVGGGQRNGADGSFSEMKITGYIWSNELSNIPGEYWLLAVYSDNATGDNPTLIPETGSAVRLCRNSKLHTGARRTYTGNDGRVYNTIVINGIEWTIENLKETLYKYNKFSMQLNGELPSAGNITWVVMCTGYPTAYITIAINGGTTNEDVYDDIIANSTYQVLAAADVFRVLFDSDTDTIWCLFKLPPFVDAMISGGDPGEVYFNYPVSVSNEIPEVQDGTDWSNLTTGAWCHYDNNSQHE